jgi:hypothetical protein
VLLRVQRILGMAKGIVRGRGGASEQRGVHDGATNQATGCVGKKDEESAYEAEGRACVCEGLVCVFEGA